ncbi:hypothetical protein HPP92_018520 [Vanilla planifolia]|uniref:Uncharacterized protein n=1 Tax=Vanilla planifolia TaxID=51239 RepID=A0A835UPG7_VANPL|nr:hypothetical protein HPP92_018520 [Vanilla planifolia]
MSSATSRNLEERWSLMTSWLHFNLLSNSSLIFLFNRLSSRPGHFHLHSDAFHRYHPLYGSSLLYAGPASLVWGWVVVSFFTWFVGIAMAEICSSFPSDNWLSLLLGCSSRWSSLGSFASWCCAWLEVIGLIAGIGTQVIAFIDMISIWWQVTGGLIMVIMLPLVALSRQPASFVFSHFVTASDSTGIRSKPYLIILSFLVSQYSLYGYDAAAHLTEETKGADKNGPIAILSSIGIISVFGWAYILALTFSIQNFDYLFDVNNETAGTFAPAQILYDAFHGRYGKSTGAIVFLFVIWGSFFFGGISITTSAARVVYALSRDKGVPFSSFWRKIHPKHKVPANAV